MASGSFVLQHPSLDDLHEIAHLEEISYPEDEAASKERIKYRLINALDYFYVWVKEENHKKEIVGFVNGTLAEGEKLTEESMKEHHKDGTTLCIHSVVISPECRRLKLGSTMLKSYVDAISTKTPVKLILLLCKNHLISFYESVGFKLLGPSHVTHGKELWYDMEYQAK